MTNVGSDRAQLSTMAKEAKAVLGTEKVASEMALHVLAYNLTRVMNIMGSKPLLAAIRA